MVKISICDLDNFNISFIFPRKAYLESEKTLTDLKTVFPASFRVNEPAEGEVRVTKRTVTAELHLCRKGTKRVPAGPLAVTS